MAERPGSRMTKEKTLPLPRSECICPICQEILLEPVTLPCKHTLCNPCFQMTVEKASLCCPFCRKRVSTWARLHSRTRTLVNTELWERIQKQYPKECQRRASGQESDDLADELASCPAPLLCQPGEIRQEYEAEVSKIEAERLAQEEAERKASEDYIQKLLAEEAAQDRLHSEAVQREMEEQLKIDEELARTLSVDLDVSNASCSSVSSVTSKKVVVSKSSKNVKNKQRVSGDIERFLTPRAVAVVGIDESMNSDSSECFIVFDEGEDEMPELSPQCPSTSLIQERGVELIMPYLSDCYKVESNTTSQQDRCSERSQVCNGTYSSCSDSIDMEESMAIKKQSTTAGLFPERGYHSPENGMESNTMNCSTPKHLGMTGTLKRKCEDCSIDLEEKAGSCRNVKKKKLSLTEDCPVPSVHAGKLIDLEENLYERRRQEEQDRLLALQLQRELDQELKQVNRGKGSPDEYQLRTKRGLKLQECQDSPLPPRKEIPVQDNSRNTQSEYSPDENKKPSRKNSVRSARVRQSRAVANTEGTSDGINVLKPSNKQPTILDLFQRSAGK